MTNVDCALVEEVLHLVIASYFRFQQNDKSSKGPASKKTKGSVGKFGRR